MYRTPSLIVTLLYDRSYKNTVLMLAYELTIDITGQLFSDQLKVFHLLTMLSKVHICSVTVLSLLFPVINSMIFSIRRYFSYMYELLFARS